MTQTPDTIREAGEIRRMFGRIAGSYDLLNHLLSLNQDRTWRTRAVAAAGVSGPVLDVCCGTGDLALEWAAGPATSVTATDFCSEMLTLAREKVAAGEGLPALPLAAADTLRLPFGRDRFAAVSAAFGIRNVTDLRGGIREMRRVARPGGKVVILEFTLPRSLLFRAVYLFYFLLVLPFIGNLVSGTRDNAYGYLPRSVMNFPGSGRLMGIIEEAGLTDVRLENLSFGIVNLFVGTKPES